jgi:flagellar FliL protein
MAEQAVANGTVEGPGGEGTAEARAKGNGPSVKTLACLVLLPALLLGGLGAGGYALGLFAPQPSQAPVPAKAVESVPSTAAAPLYYELPDLLVELETGGEVPTLLKISATLEVEDEATLGRLNSVMPRVLENFQVYLSELDLEDLQGSAGFDRVSEALLLRVNASIRPANVRDVRLMEVLVQ